MNRGLHDRVRRVRSRTAVRSWDYRQREHARGVWFRLRRALADAREAYAISDDDAERLMAEGAVALAVGAQLAPARTLLFVSAERIGRLASARSLPLHLGAELLSAKAIALVPFDDGTGGT